MEKAIMCLIVIALMAPGLAMAKGAAKTTGDQVAVDEYGEEYVPPDPNVVEQVAPAKQVKKAKPASAVQEADIGTTVTAKPDKKASKKEAQSKAQAAAPSNKGAVKQTPASPPAYSLKSSSVSASGRDHRFRVGIVGPGIGVASQGVGALMTIGAEGEYYFFEKLSAVFRLETATKFKEPTLLSFLPMARYTFDFDRFPRWAIYMQAGVGLGLYIANGTHAAADIAIPGGGFWWQWTDHFSVGADAQLHIYARNSTIVGFTFAPAFRYLF